METRSWVMAHFVKMHSCPEATTTSSTVCPQRKPLKSDNNRGKSGGTQCPSTHAKSLRDANSRSESALFGNNETPNTSDIKIRDAYNRTKGVRTAYGDHNTAAPNCLAAEANFIIRLSPVPKRRAETTIALDMCTPLTEAPTPAVQHLRPSTGHLVHPVNDRPLCHAVSPLCIPRKPNWRREDLTR